jgi:hypothetical protein
LPSGSDWVQHRDLSAGLVVFGGALHVNLRAT